MIKWLLEAEKGPFWDRNYLVPIQKLDILFEFKEGDPPQAD